MILTILVPVFNGIEYTKKCLANLSNLVISPDNQKFNIEIIIIDDGSTDGTSTWIQENYPKVHVLYGDGNLWWSGGINKGILYSLNVLNTNYILWWNNDIIAGNDYFNNLFKLLNINPKNNLIGSKIFELNKKNIFGFGGKFNPKTGQLIMFGERAKDSFAFQKPIVSDWFPGMGTVIHKSVFEKVGLLDEENFPQYYGDSDFTLRAKKNGFTLTAYPNLIIYNDTSNSGIKHNNSIKALLRSLHDIKSFYNLNVDIKFYKKHGESILTYLILVEKYFYYIGGFFKWKLLSILKLKYL